MMDLETILAIYIDINLLLLCTALVWVLARRWMASSEIGKAFTAQFLLLKLLIVSAFILPVALTISANLFNSSETVPTTLSDLILAQYLQGNVQVSADFLEKVLALRQNVTSQLANSSHPIVYLLLAGMLATALLMLVRTALTAVKLRKILHSAHEWRSFGNLHFLMSDTVHVPFSTRTLRRKFIVLPSSMLTRHTDTKVALAHELEHLRQSDVDWEMGVALLTPLLFWNPAFHYFKRQLEEFRELSCDQRVLSRGLLRADDYCACLLRVCENRFHRPKLFQLRVPEVALAETRLGLVGNRPARLLANRLLSAAHGSPVKTAFWKVTVAALVLLAAASALSFTIQKPQDWSHDRLMLSTIINLERLEHRNQASLGSYKSY